MWIREPDLSISGLYMHMTEEPGLTLVWLSVTECSDHWNRSLCSESIFPSGWNIHSKNILCLYSQLIWHHNPNHDLSCYRKFLAVSWQVQNVTMGWHLFRIRYMRTDFQGTKNRCEIMLDRQNSLLWQIELNNTTSMYISSHQAYCVLVGISCCSQFVSEVTRTFVQFLYAHMQSLYYPFTLTTWPWGQTWDFHAGPSMTIENIIENPHDCDNRENGESMKGEHRND